MALPSSGPLSISDIRLMFGGFTPHSLSEYYKGGTYVLSTDTAPNVPSSGTIKISDFYGAGIVESYVTTISAGTASSIEYNSFGSVASVFVEDDGDIVGNGNLLDFTKEFVTGTARSFYQVKFTKMSDTTSGTGTSSIIGVFDTWLDVGSGIEVEANADGTNCSRTITIKVEIRRKVDQVLVSSTGTNVLTIKAKSNVGLTP